MKNGTSVSRILAVLTALFAALSGVYLLVGGIWLAKIGGSLYYIVAGVVLLVTAWLLYRRRASALFLYAIFLLGTTIWSVWEVGTDFWALTPRLDIIFFLGLWIFLPVVYRTLTAEGSVARSSLGVSLVITVAVLGYAVFNDPQEINGTLQAAQPTAEKTTSDIPDGDWPAYGRTQAGTRYSPLSQINDKNVGQLTQAWSFQTGDVKTDNDPGEFTSEVTPLMIRDTLYLCTPHQKLFALDAATGKPKWKFDPYLQSNPTFQHVTCRGVSYHETPAAAQTNNANNTAPALCARRILLPVNDGRLFALDADTGERCPDFADKGELNLQSNMPYATLGHYEPTSPPVVTDKVIVIAGAVTDNYSTKEPSGVIRGFDVNSGKLLWAFDPGSPTPNKIPDDEHHFTPNSPNSWAPASYDKNLDIVYLPMGVQTPDIWGGNRTPDMERYASGILALNASTGKLVWFYQTVHHDLWDMDVPAQPTLADITDKDGNKVPVIYVPTKTGNIFVLDRRDGKLVVPAPERPVPQGPAKGDRLSPTQPFSELTFRPEAKLTGADMWGATMYDQLVCRVIFQKLRYEGTFTPPSEQGTLVFPGNLGMFEWGGLSVDTDRQVAIANPIALPFVSKLIPRGPGNLIEPDANDKGGSGTESGIQPQYGVPFGVTLNPFLSPFGLPCKQPAWGYISAVDLKTNDIVWKKRIGTVRDSSPLPLPFKMGMPMLGGPVSTAGNIFFIAATADNYLRAFNMSNGEKLWQARLPAGGQATPMTYEVNGKQYVVISAGGHGSFGTKLGDYIIAYALPDTK